MNEKLRLCGKFFTRAVMIFTVCILFVTVTGVFSGDSAESFSSLFSMGSSGIAYATILQMAALSAIISLINTILFGAGLFSGLMTIWKTVIMLLLIIAVSIVFIIAFGWFPIDNAEAWIGFGISFGSCFAASTAVMFTKTCIENKRLERSLSEYKRNKESENAK